MHRIIRVLIVGVVSWCALAARSAAQDVYSSAALVPGDANLVFAVHDAAKLRREPVGRTGALLAEGVFGFTRTGEAWGKLSRQLGLTPEESFDRLLGTRFVFVQRWSADGKSSWAIRSVVDRETDRLLRERLKPAPRKVEKGQTILAIEEGAFWLAIGGERESPAILLGPSDATALFDELVPTLQAQGPAESLAAQPFFRDVRAIDRDARALVFWRWTGLGVAPGEGWLACAFNPIGKEVKIGFISYLKSLELPGQDAAAWSREAFDELSRDAYFALMDWDAPLRARWGPLRAIADQWPKLPPEIAGDRKEPGLAGPRRVLAFLPSDDVPFAPVFAMETVHTKKLAAVGDRFLSESIAWLEQFGAPAAKPAEAGAGGNDAAPRKVDFAGVFPEALRTVEFGERFGPIGAMLAPRGSEIAWTFRAGGSVVEKPDAGWWTLGIDGASVERTAAALARTHEQRVIDEPTIKNEKKLPLLSLGVARPAAFAANFQKRGVPIPAGVLPLVRAARTVEHLQWQAIRGPNGTVIGWGAFTLMPEPAFEKPKGKAGK